MDKENISNETLKRIDQEIMFLNKLHNYSKHALTGLLLELIEPRYRTEAINRLNAYEMSYLQSIMNSNGEGEA